MSSRRLRVIGYRDPVGKRPDRAVLSDVRDVSLVDLPDTVKYLLDTGAIRVAITEEEQETR